MAQASIIKSRNCYVWAQQDPCIFSQFSLLDDAQEFAATFSQNYPDFTPVIGTYSEHQQALRDNVDAVQRHQYDDFVKTVNNDIAILRAEIACLEAIKPVIQKFDGKVLNKRFHDAVKEAAGFSNSFSEYYFELHKYGDFLQCTTDRKQPAIFIRYSSDNWQWKTNDRLDAAQALPIIDKQIQTRLDQIATFEAQPALFRDYIDKAQALRQQIQELHKSVPYQLRRYCKAQRLTGYCSEADEIYC